MPCNLNEWGWASSGATSVLRDSNSDSGPCSSEDAARRPANDNLTGWAQHQQVCLLTVPLPVLCLTVLPSRPPVDRVDRSYRKAKSEGAPHFVPDASKEN